MINYSVDTDGIATISWDMPGRSMNVLNNDSIPAFAGALEKAIGDDAVKGIIITSGKPDFIAGADLEMLQGWKGAEEMFQNGMELQMMFRSIEKAKKPVVAAINGTALGGGFEICLACHHRIAADNPKAKIGLPEVKVGLLPGGGGTQRLPRLIGIQAALPLLLEGKHLSPEKALKAGMVNAVVPANDLLAEAKKWLLNAKPEDAVQPWDKKGFRLPGGIPMSPGGMMTFTAGNAMLREKTMGNYPAALNIMSCVYEGCCVDIDNGLKIETRYFVKTCGTPEAKNMIRSLFFGIGNANKLASRPKDIPTQTFTKVGVLGAGMMGAGIAYSTAVAGIDVVLIDRDQAAADKGKAYSEKLLQKAVGRGRMSQEKAEAVLGRITATTDYALLDGAELVIEAVFENREIKADVTGKSEAVIAEDAIFASNTSTLPISGLAEASKRPANFIGLHFFSPVDKMPLVEIICGKETSQETLARSMDYVKAIRKTPIVVNDSRGFYTSRVFGTYVNEGIAMLAEGINPALIDMAGKMSGMPVGPLALADEVAIDLIYKVRNQTRDDLGDKYIPSPSDATVTKMVEELNRVGKREGKGFYDYPEGGKKHLWKELGTHFPQLPEDEQPSVEEVIKRLLYIQSVETARCLEENVVTTPEDADVGSILGWGFAPSRGGAISQIHTVGVDNFVAECDRMAQAYGARFTPPQFLRDMASKGETFYAA
ncbi:3-hydroxyacyl-CoA dehydrogenase NAD-binding domain-containing protein [Sneathiella chinensis]|uniref:Fatty oxidation complex subunit alpha n=1 Tax=Sneathiella chinensis TaxID=349750 RepID=A0ABQ5U4S6_9PROT|nr:3-hydroxyacyl-CoA dehydrogenase NAD-binding domain-containing protein [Sneathiella chinensis]GLQ05486.1 fatty oxidation complex subunit alpha [Sneathiella chinensis]